MTKKKLLNKKTWILFMALFMAGSPAFSGCSKEAEEAPLPTPVEDERITLFGTVAWQESSEVSLPFDIKINSISVRSGQPVSKGDILFSVDVEELAGESSSTEEALAILELKKSSYERELEAESASLNGYLEEARQNRSRLIIAAPHEGRVLDVQVKEGDKITKGQKLSRFVDDRRMLLRVNFIQGYEDAVKPGMAAQVSFPDNMDQVPATVEKVERAGGKSPQGVPLLEAVLVMENPGALTEGMTAYGAVLSDKLGTLTPIEAGTLAYYRDTPINALTDGMAEALLMKEGYAFKEGETLLKLTKEVQEAGAEKAYTLSAGARIDAKTALVRETENQILQLREKLDIMKRVIKGELYSHLRMDETGTVRAAEDGFLADKVMEAGKERIKANEPLLVLASLNSLEAVCYAEEQLARHIRPGDKAQVSLYSDTTAIALGQVAYVSQKAVVQNGETMIEVVIEYEDEGRKLLPGYNIVAKITPAKN